MVPPAPVTFSITTGCPSDCPIRSPTTRAITSVGPPAANGTIMVIGRDGKDCAAALPANPDVAATAIIAKTKLCIGKVHSLTAAFAKAQRRVYQTQTHWRLRPEASI